MQSLAVKFTNFRFQEEAEDKVSREESSKIVVSLIRCSKLFGAFFERPRRLKNSGNFQVSWFSSIVWVRVDQQPIAHPSRVNLENLKI